MRLNIITGTNFIDINDTQIDLIGQGLIQGRRQLVIVPDRFSLTMERLILDKLNLVATFNVEVVSFARMSSKMLARLNAPQVLSSLGATMVIEMLLLEHEKELLCFGSTIKTISFASILFDSIAQLKSCKISPIDLLNSIENIKNKSLQLKLHDIALIYKYYEEYLSDVYIDSNNKLQLLCENIADSRDFERTDVHFCNFDSMTNQGLDVVKVLLRQANSVNIGVTLPNREQANAEIYNLEMYNNLQVLSKNLNITPTFLSANSTLPNWTNHILDNLMAIKPSKFELPDTTTVRLYTASNRRQEVEWLAIDLLNKVKGGARFRDFAVNCSKLESYAPIIKKVFAVNKIPVWIDLPFKLQNSEGYKFIQSAFDCIQDGFQAKDVLRFIKNTLIGLSATDCEVFENVVNKYCLVGKNFQEISAPKNEDADFEKFLEIRKNLMPLFTFAKNIEISKTIAEMVSSTYVFLEEMQFVENLDGLTQAYLEDGDLERNSIARQNFNKLDNVLTQMRDIMGQTECDFAEFNKIWKTGTSTITISPLPVSMDCVYVGQSLQSVFTATDYYYILGAVDGDFPAFVNDVGLIADKDISALDKFSVQITPTIRQVNERSRFSVLQSFSYAKKGLIVSYPLNNDAEECKPAGAINSLTNMFTFRGGNLESISLSEMLKDDNYFGGQKQRLGYLWLNKHSILDGFLNNLDNTQISKKNLSSAYKVLNKYGYNELLENFKTIKNNEVKVAKLSNPDKVFFTKDKVNVTQIEKFYDCPYAHFLTYGLRLKQKKTARIEAVDVGNILHAVLERFGRLIRKCGVQEDNKIESIVTEMFDEIMQLKEFEYLIFAGHNETFLSALKSEAVRACQAINYQLSHSQYKIKFIEAKFGTEGFVPVPEIAIINTNRRVKVSGKIDRADIFNNRLRIIDYKTSKYSADFKLLNFYLGKKIQLFYYLQVILSALGMQVGGAYYLPVHKEYLEKTPFSRYSGFCMQGVTLDNAVNALAQDDQISFEHTESDIIKVKISNSKTNITSGEFVFDKRIGVVASEEQFKNILNYAVQVLENALNDISQGLIEPLFASNACDFCPYAKICRVGTLIEKQQRKENFKVDLDTFNFKEKENEI